MDQKQKFIGTFEKVNFPEFNIKGVVAKIDTGAYTGAMHCIKIKEKATKNGPVLHFSPFGTKITKSTSRFKVKPVKSSNGQEEMRYAIETDIEINGVTYSVMLTLANRSDMKAPVLIGRRFLRRNHLMVDARRINK